ncbi:MAG: hypothetical protein KDA61_15060 [Planctomycetales bacterium]|nr:hypothetical protein [Planctomycetales bacterium]
MARTLAPEDVRVGDYVSLLYVVRELPAVFFCDDWQGLAPDEMLRFRTLPEMAGEPLKVQAVCLPFVLVKRANGERRPLDLRRVQVARLDRNYAKTARKLSKRKSKPSSYF